MTPEEQLAALRRLNDRILSKDRRLREESADHGLERRGGDASVAERIDEESIVMRRMRPVLAIRNDETEIAFRDPEDSQVWRERLESVGPVLTAANRAVGRIELSNHRKPWVGTGWLVAEDILVTNRHVADVFATREHGDLVFKPGLDGGPTRASIDFLQEIDNPDARVFEIAKVLHVEPRPGPDVAFLSVAPRAGGRALERPIPLSSRPPSADPSVGVIGYPARDPRVPEPDLMLRIFGDVFDKKRFAPGTVTRTDETRVFHDCSTLGGNSGSAVIDLESGEAIGLHFSGGFLRTNLAVRADVVARLLDQVRRGTRRSRSAPSQARSRRRSATRGTQRVHDDLVAVSAGGDGSPISVTIPLTLTLSIGHPRVRSIARSGGKGGAPADDRDIDEDFEDEATVEDYLDREGYVENFLGDEFVVPLPEVVDWPDDLLEFDVDGEADTVLRYHHFSVVMSASRRLCYFSAVNIDGALSRKTKRSGWRTDPRIPKAQQIKGECYGNPPKFSRGHMTRREDPAWGSKADADLGNDDSMHVTNAVPQMQAFNSPIWLGLEDYALQNAREDDMRISVFTGPYMFDDDPEKFGVLVPTSFWKIIVFVHDETGELCATGYEMSDDSLTEDEFVFGEYTSPQLNRTIQVPIATIEEKSGISFGGLADLDPMAELDEAVGELEPLAALEQIRFTR